jgi:hypothetical protein
MRPVVSGSILVELENSGHMVSGMLLFEISAIVDIYLAHTTTFSFERDALMACPKMQVASWAWGPVTCQQIPAECTINAAAIVLCAIHNWCLVLDAAKSFTGDSNVFAQNLDLVKGRLRQGNE